MQLDDMELEVEFKEKRRDNLRKRPAVSEHSEPSAETWETLAGELKLLKERLPVVVRSLGQVRSKLQQVDGKLGLLEKAHRDILSTKKELRQAEEDRNLKEQVGGFPPREDLLFFSSSFAIKCWYGLFFLVFLFLFFIFTLYFGKFGPPYPGKYTAAAARVSATQSYKCKLGLFVFP